MAQQAGRQGPWLVASLVVIATAAIIWLTVPTLMPSASESSAIHGNVAKSVDCFSSRTDDAFTAEGVQRLVDSRIAACRFALTERPDNLDVKVALAKALTVKDRTKTVALLREAAAAGRSDAFFELYEQHRSWDRNLDRPALVTRDEAEASLRKAAELGHREAAYRLAIALDRGHILKRDPAQARLWAARVAENVPAGTRRSDVLVFLGRLLAESEDSTERQRGRTLLEQIAADGGTYNAKTVLAVAIRRDDPTRARSLLESNLRADPGGATVELADMLIKGEGGQVDIKRAVRLLQGPTDVPSVRGALGRLYLDGQLVPQDIRKGIEFIRILSVWDYDAKIELEQLLANHPDVRIERGDVILYEATEIAELGEPGAVQAIIGLRFSQHPQFRDVAEGCRWIDIARNRGLSVPDEASMCEKR